MHHGVIFRHIRIVGVGRNGVESLPPLFLLVMPNDAKNCLSNKKRWTEVVHPAAPFLWLTQHTHLRSALGNQTKCGTNVFFGLRMSWLSLAKLPNIHHHHHNIIVSIRLLDIMIIISASDYTPTQMSSWTRWVDRDQRSRSSFVLLLNSNTVIMLSTSDNLSYKYSMYYMITYIDSIHYEFGPPWLYTAAWADVIVM